MEEIRFERQNLLKIWLLSKMFLKFFAYFQETQILMNTS